MLYAINSSKERIKASKGLEGFCPDCGQLLIPKCGMIKIHHECALFIVQQECFHETRNQNVTQTPT